MILDAVRDLYLTRWGVPLREASFDACGHRIGVLKWEASSATEGVAIYATLGASADPMVGSDPHHRVEFFIGLLPENDDVARPLSMLASYPAREATTVGAEHTVTLPQPLWPGTPMRSFLVMSQVGDILPPLELPDGIHVEFMQAIPVFESELAFKATHGADALMQRWERTRVPFWSPNRQAEPAGR